MAIQKNFVIKNGLEVDTNLIVADAQTNKVGIGTTVPQYTLHVNGGIGATDLRVTGVGTFSVLNANNAYVNTAYINSGVITSFVSTSGTITSLSGTNLNYSGISTLEIITSNQIGSQNLNVTGVSTFFQANISDVNINQANINIGFSTSFTIHSGIITSLSGTNLNYSGISTLGIITSNQITSNQIVSQNLNVIGISTFNNIVLDGYVSVGGTIGFEGQVLVSTGVGVTWSRLTRDSLLFTAAPEQDTFPFNYDIGSVEIYINGVRLAPNEFQATNGSSVILNDPCFGGETVEILANRVIPVGESILIGITVEDEGSTVGTANTITLLNFIGSGVTVTSAGAYGVDITINNTSNVLNASSVTTNSTFFPVFVAGTGDRTPSIRDTATAFSFNPSTGTLTVGGDLNSGSDERLKKNIETIENALDTVENLRGVKFDWKESGRPSLGVIAQELENVIPELVNGDENKTVTYNGLIAILIEALKELKERVEVLEQNSK